MKSATKFILFLLIVIGCSRDIEREIHLIPHGYKGDIFIIFDQINGVNKEFKNSSRLYRIPENGILRTEFKPNPGVLPNSTYLQFYYVDSKDSIIGEIPFYFYIDQPDSLNLRYPNRIISSYYYGGGVGRFFPYDSNLDYLIYTIDTIYQ